MVKLSPLIRLTLTGLAATIGVIASTVPLPTWAAAVIVGADTILAGVGIIPPHVPVTTHVVTPPVPSGSSPPVV